MYDSTVIREPPDLDSSVKTHGIPFTQIAVDLGKAMVKNTVALGATVAATKIFPVQRFVTTMEEALQNNCALLPINREAFRCGMEAFAGLAQK